MPFRQILSLFFLPLPVWEGEVRQLTLQMLTHSQKRTVNISIQTKETFHLIEWKLISQTFFETYIEFKTRKVLNFYKYHPQLLRGVYQVLQRRMNEADLSFHDQMNWFDQWWKVQNLSTSMNGVGLFEQSNMDKFSFLKWIPDCASSHQKAQNGSHSAIRWHARPGYLSFVIGS